MATDEATARVDRWLAALLERHTADTTRPQFLKAVRALSARYVERRGTLAERTPTDSAGKRAAFAGFYAPLHFFTTRAVVEALRLQQARHARLIDLGCGTGAASAAWALASDTPPAILGIDRHGWALAEAAWTWRTLGLDARGERGDLVRAAEALARKRATPGSMALVLGWTVNEIDEAARRRLLPALVHLAEHGAASLVIEPIARRVSPWWEDWARAATRLGGQAIERRFELSLPPRLAALGEAAGFQQAGTAARAIWLARSLSNS